MKNLNHKFYIFVVCTIIISLSPISFSQKNSVDTITVAFWNLENLFDTENDSIKNDEEFLPEAKSKWDTDKYEKKLFNLSRVIRSMNNEKGPDILGVCEVENKKVLIDLTKKYLPELKYEIAHLESPDNRGIDVALLYKKNKYKINFVKGDTVKLEDGYPTRLILFTSLKTKNNDTLNLFVNHWPSRRGGETASEKNRIVAAKVLRKNIDSLFGKNPESKIIILGDLNDEPNNISITDYLKAKPYLCENKADSLNENDLLNLAYKTFIEGEGTYKFRDKWNQLDQMIISKSFIDNSKFYYHCSSFEIYKPYFLQTHSGKFQGAPFPTFGHGRYLGGYSDHFPILAKFIYKEKIK
ncbi:MAG: endonuclease [Ignavibacterium sp.]